MRLPFLLSWVAATLLVTAAPVAAQEPTVDLFGEFGNGRYCCFAFAPNGKFIALGWSEGVGLDPLDDETIQKLSAPSDRWKRTPSTLAKGSKHSAVFLAFTADCKNLASADEMGTVKLWDVSARKERASLKTGAKPTSKHEGNFPGFYRKYPAPLALAPDGRSFASYSTAPNRKTGELKLWDLTSGKARVLTGHRDIVHALAFSPDGNTLATASADHTAMLWDVKTGKKIHTLKEHIGPVWAVAFSSDGKTLATEASDRLLKLWDVTTGQDHTSLDVGEGLLALVPRALAFSPDGKTLARYPESWNSDSAGLWDLATGKRLATLPGYRDRPHGESLAFSPDGKWVGAVSGSGDNFSVAFLWSVGKLFESKPSK